MRTAHEKARTAVSLRQRGWTGKEMSIEMACGIKKNGGVVWTLAELGREKKQDTRSSFRFRFRDADAPSGSGMGLMANARSRRFLHEDVNMAVLSWEGGNLSVSIREGCPHVARSCCGRKVLFARREAKPTSRTKLRLTPHFLPSSPLLRALPLCCFRSVLLTAVAGRYVGELEAALRSLVLHVLLDLVLGDDDDAAAGGPGATGGDGDDGTSTAAILGEYADELLVGFSRGVLGSAACPKALAVFYHVKLRLCCHRTRMPRCGALCRCRSVVGKIRRSLSWMPSVCNRPLFLPCWGAELFREGQILGQDRLLPIHDHRHHSDRSIR